MNLYKVHFDTNNAVSSEQLYIPLQGTVKLETVNGAKTLKWLTVYADSEVESLNIAGKVVEDFFQLLKVA